MSITLIAAVARDNVIGSENDIPWYLPEDLKHFKEITEGKVCLMGRKTFESIIRRLGKPLPNRLSILITHNADYEVPSGVIVYNDLQQAIADYQTKELFIIGGGQIFAQTIGRADKLYITHVEFESKGDSFFPHIDPVKWRMAEEQKYEHFSFATYRRI